MLRCINRLLVVVTVGFGHVILAASPNATRIDPCSTFAAVAVVVITTSIVVFGEHFIEEVRVVKVDQVGICCVHGVLSRFTRIRLATILVLGTRTSLHLTGLPGADLRACVCGTARNGLRLDHLVLGGGKGCGRGFLVVMGLRMVLGAGCRGRLLRCRGCCSVIDDVDLIADDDAGVRVGVVLRLLAARGNAPAEL